MPDAFLIQETNPAPVPGTHVLVIGVGSYPCLLGGNPARLYGKHQNLAQLVSPPKSARAVADWFVKEFSNPDRPLASVALLVSEPGGDPAIAATADNICTAVREWFHRCNTHERNLPIFYFCGHGLGSGGLLALLAEDFGSDALAPLDGALDFRHLHAGMTECLANQQLFLVDACRTDARLVANAAGLAGRAPIQPQGGGAWTERPVLYSTLQGLAAYGRDERSHFADALLAAFEGTASDDAEGDWRVNTNTLHRALSVHMRRKIEAGLASAQIPPADVLTTFDLHWLRKPPRVPVYVSCRPSAAARHGELHYGKCGAALEPAGPARTDVWEMIVEAGHDYDFEARFPANEYRGGRLTKVHVSPPHKKVPPLEVE